MTEKAYEIVCNFCPGDGRPCHKGKVLYYGEMGGPPPRLETCPKCGGTGKKLVKREYIENQIRSHEKQIKLYQDYIYSCERSIKYWEKIIGES